MSLNVLIYGAGTVGTNALLLASSLGHEIAAVKRSISDNRRTRDLAHAHKSLGGFSIHLTPGEDLEQRLAAAERQPFLINNEPYTLPVRPYTAELGKGCDVIIDATDDKATAATAAQHAALGKPYLLQGGADETLAPSFLSAPNCIGHLEAGRYRNAPARQVSCNTTYASTALGLLLTAFSPDTIGAADIYLRRRCRDPGEEGKMLTAPSKTEEHTHHADDVALVLPQLQGKLASRANKNPWEHFHRAELTVTLAQDIGTADLVRIQNLFRNYPRCAHAERDLGGTSFEAAAEGVQRLRAIGESLGLPDGDLLLPVYTVERLDSRTLSIKGYNPQRSIVTLSCMDWMQLAAGTAATWEDAFATTNRGATWHGHGITELKKALETKINHER
jgi:glyceraldehyde-3-phosphate dehydrogenase/erythrose-4-phosphate dehydrogenase